MAKNQSDKETKGLTEVSNMSNVYSEDLSSFEPESFDFVEFSSQGIPIRVLEAKSKVFTNIVTLQANIYNVAIFGTGSYNAVVGGYTGTSSPSQTIGYSSTMPYLENYLAERKLLEKRLEAVDMLEQRVGALEKRVASLEAVSPEEKVIVLRELSKEEAKKEILELFSKQDRLYYSDIAEQLSLDLKLVVDICSELQAAGEIHALGDSS